jgi:DNA recombination protein RmuC
MPEIVTLLLLCITLVVLAFVVVRLIGLGRAQAGLPETLMRVLEEKHRLMLADLHEGLNRQGDRLIATHAGESERLRHAVGEELRATRDAINALQTKQDQLRSEMLAQTLAKLAEQAREDQKLIQDSFRNATQHLASSIETLSRTVDGRLEQISGKVAERLDEGFKKTNETFANVMARLATIDEAQKKIDGLTTNVVSLQHLLGDKRSRGAFGEVQLEGLVRNILPPDAYSFQTKLSNGNRVDCLLVLPPPTGKVPVDAKFPLENYHRMLDSNLAESDKQVARRQFKQDVRRHIEDIGQKYLIRNETSDGAVMFVPAEAVFAEIHAYHADIVEYAMSKHVWIVSPTTLMAVLNTARAVMKDVQMREQVHIIQSELGKLGVDFRRFDERMKKLAEHIRQANKDVDDVQISSRKISEQFSRIEAVEVRVDGQTGTTRDKLE